MSFPSKAPSSHPPGLKLGVFAGGGPFPRLVAPGIVVVGDLAQLCASANPGFPSSSSSSSPLATGIGGSALALASAPSTSTSASAYYAQMGVTHVLTRYSSSSSSGIAELRLPADGSVQLLLIGEAQTLREVVELLVRVRVARPHGQILVVGEPYVAAAYLMAIEGRDLQGTWRLVTGEALSGSRGVFKEVHGVLGTFAREVEEEGKRIAMEEEEQQQQQHRRVEEQHALQPRRKRGKRK